MQGTAVYIAAVLLFHFRDKPEDIVLSAEAAPEIAVGRDRLSPAPDLVQAGIRALPAQEGNVHLVFFRDDQLFWGIRRETNLRAEGLQRHVNRLRGQAHRFAVVIHAADLELIRSRFFENMGIAVLRKIAGCRNLLPVLIQCEFIFIGRNPEAGGSLPLADGIHAAVGDVADHIQIFGGSACQLHRVPAAQSIPVGGGSKAAADHRPRREGLRADFRYTVRNRHR